MLQDSGNRSWKLTLSVGKSDGQSLSLWLSLRDISNSGPDPGSVAADVWSELHVADDCRLSVSMLYKSTRELINVCGEDLL